MKNNRIFNFLIIYLLILLQVGFLKAQDNLVKINETKSGLIKFEADTLNPQEINLIDIEKLYVFCRIWGILKYHHPNISKFDIDKEMVDMFPLVLKARTTFEFNDYIVNWIKKFKLHSFVNQSNPNKENIIYKPNYDDIYDNHLVSDELENFIRELVSLKSNNFYASYNEQGKVVYFQNEKSYEEIKTPNQAYQYLALFRYWNAVEYFFPYKESLKKSWKHILMDIIPEFANNKNTFDYVQDVLRLTSSLEDSHALVSETSYLVKNYRGKYVLPIQARFLDDTLVVVGYYNDTLDIKNSILVGDIIKSINGIDLPKLIDLYTPLIHGSNRVTILKNIILRHLFRSDGELIPLTVLRDGQEIKLEIPTIDYNSLNEKIDYSPSKFINTFSLIDGDIGYVVASRYKVKDFHILKEDIKKTKGIIIDLRYGALESMIYSLVPYLNSNSGIKKYVKFIEPIEYYPGYFKLGKEQGYKGSGNYDRKVVVLVNEFTQSHAEFTAMAFQASNNVIVMGSTTAGANGTTVMLTLPTGIKTWFTGNESVYPDNTPFQRVGVKIDKLVRPSLKGIKEGRDELLEKALAYLRE